MKTMFKAAALAGAAIAGTVLTAAPAAAQVGGLAATDPAQVVAGSSALLTAYKQIAQTYSAQAATASQLSTEIQNLGKQLDTNGDNQISDQEAAAARTSNPALIQQIDAKEKQISTAQQPILTAQLYVVEQLLAQFTAAAQQVSADKKISAILSPEALIYAPPAIDVTPALTAALNARVPTASITVPAGWQPQRQTMQIHQQVAQIMIYMARQQQQQQAQPTATQPQGR
ncbi:MAG: OmpH family outer membrane protein [Sphingomonadales bacterium]|nr:OmpH family outer membrane protein [Sphingomonadales bacterium]